MGEQHYKKSSRWIDKWSQRKNMTIDKSLHYRKLKDRYKRMYAKSQGYSYLAIPYWTDNKQEEWKQLINNRINEIINNQDCSNF
jgi:hypothetical protein